MTGPAVGGAFAGLGVWRPGFWMMVPVVLVVPALSWRMLGRSFAGGGRLPASVAVVPVDHGHVDRARLESHRVRAAIVLGPCLVTAGFLGLFTTIGAGPLPAIAACIVLVGLGIGTCWAHVSKIVRPRAAPMRAR
jgi:hypothetical protein